MIRSALIAVFASVLILVSAHDAKALTAQEVSDGLDVRIVEIQSAIGDTQSAIGSATTPSEQAILNRVLRLQQARLRQLQTFQRVIFRFPEQRLLALVEHFDLPVSRS